MPNIALALKSEISRLARKEVANESVPLKKAISGYRSEIAALKRRAEAAEQQIRHLSKTIPKPVEAVQKADKAAETKLRFSAKSLVAQRRRLDLSADDCGLLLGTSGQSIYNWETGKARPRAQYLPAIAALRALGKKTAMAVLATRKR